MRCRDAAITWRCKNLIRFFGDCKRCDGTGICWRFEEADDAFQSSNCGGWERDHIRDTANPKQCRQCKGLGSCFVRSFGRTAG
jgi:hypothetical protein